jgi:S1-C subfamily serine protease
MNSIVAPVIRKAAGFRTLVRRCHWAENVSHARLGLIRLFIGALLLSLADVPEARGENISSGSGFLIEPKGYILTNHHVIAGAQRVGVVLSASSKHEAEVVAVDEYKDLALLKIQGKDFPTAAIGDSEKSEVMDHVMVLGFPLVEDVGTELSMSDGRINSIREGGRIPGLKSMLMSTLAIAADRSLMSRARLSE